MKKKVLIFGGTGFIGESIVDELILKGFTPILLVRNENNLKDSWKGKCEFVFGDIRNIESLYEKFVDFTPIATIYSIGLIRENLRNKFDDFHYNWAKKALELSSKLKIQQFIYISANGVQNESTEYERTKLNFENYLKSKFDNYTIFRPSIVFDKSEKYNFNHELNKLTKYFLTPVIGKGNFLLAPVYRKDISKVIVTSILHSNAINKTYEVCGPKKYSFKKILQIYADSRDRKIVLINIPIKFIKLITSVFGKYNFFPITSDQLKMLVNGNTCVDNSFLEDLGITELKSFDSF